MYWARSRTYILLNIWLMHAPTDLPVGVLMVYTYFWDQLTGLLYLCSNYFQRKLRIKLLLGASTVSPTLSNQEVRMILVLGRLPELYGTGFGGTRI